MHKDNEEALEEDQFDMSKMYIFLDNLAAVIKTKNMF